MNMHAYIVLLAIGTAAFHDSGRRLEIDVIAPSKLDAAVIAEKTGNIMVSDEEYVYVKNVREVRTTKHPTPGLAMALAA